ncbi:MAG: DHA2 family efflux MFS transporter permease subunit [Patescibacteria group bacterium]|nr:DHA2 family efflux MFS transporter permease subunit [Patescibacteria group bacterium]
MKDSDEKTSSPWLILLTVMVGTLLIGLDRTVVNLGVPKIMSEFGITITTAGWIATAYIISNAVFVPVFGKLGDMFGNRFIYLWSFVAFIVISLIVGLSWSIGSLIFFRAIQGLVGAAIYPTAMSLIAKTFRDRQERAQALGIWAGSFAASAVIGPLVGGPLIDNFSWRMLFYINFPVGVVGLLMVLAFLPKDRPQKKEKFDYAGSIILAVALSSLVLVLDKGQEWGWTSFKSFSAYFVTIASGIIFYFVEKRAKNPLIDLNFFKNPVFVSALSVTFISFGGFMGAMFLIPIFAQTFLGYGATETGYLFLPLALTMMVVSPLGARISSYIAPRWSVSIGMLISTIGFFILSQRLDPLTKGSDLIFPLFLFAVGLGLGMAPLTNAVASSVPPREVGIASGILNLTRNIAGAIGIAFFGTLLTNQINLNVQEISVHTTINSFLPNIAKVVPGLVILKAQVASYGFVFFVASFVMLAGALTALTLRESSKDYADEIEGETKDVFVEV